jgi:hypothetical protein
MIMNEQQTEYAFMQLGIQEFFATQEDVYVDLEDCFGLIHQIEVMKCKR